MTTVKIHSEYILLGQMLKFSGIIGNGGEAKSFLSSNFVFINGNLDQRRGKKLYPGDIIEVLNTKYLIVSDEK